MQLAQAYIAYGLGFGICTAIFFGFQKRLISQGRSHQISRWKSWLVLLVGIAGVAWYLLWYELMKKLEWEVNLAAIINILSCVLLLAWSMLNTEITRDGDDPATKAFGT